MTGTRALIPKISEEIYDYLKKNNYLNKDDKNPIWSMYNIRARISQILMRRIPHDKVKKA
jgi:hypothetical protein